MNTKTEKPKFLGTKTEKTDLKNTQNQKYQCPPQWTKEQNDRLSFPPASLFSREDTTFL